MRRAVTQFGAARVPISLGILLDISGSMMQGRMRAQQTTRDGATRGGRWECCWQGLAQLTRYVHADGKYHPIRVRTKDTRLKVRGRAGYIAPPRPLGR